MEAGARFVVLGEILVVILDLWIMCTRVHWRSRYCRTFVEGNKNIQCFRVLEKRVRAMVYTPIFIFEFVLNLYLPVNFLYEEE